MPLWLQILLPTSIVLMILSRGSQSASSATVDTSHEDNTARLWHAYYALQNSLISLARSIEAVDANLGVIIVVGIAGFTYFLDRADRAAEHAAAIHGTVYHYPWVFAGLLLLPLFFAVLALVRLTPEEGPDAKAFVVYLQTHEVEALQDAITEMAQTYEHNLALRYNKQLVQLSSVVAYIAILVLAGLWPRLVGILAHAWALVLQWSR